MPRSLVTIAVVVLGLIPAGFGMAQVNNNANSGWFAFRNDTSVQVIVQTSTMGPNNQERRGLQRQINPRDAAYDPVAGQGAKTVTIYDSKGQVLLKETVQYRGKNVHFAIQQDGVNKDKTPKLRLAAVAEPRMVQGNNPNNGAMPRPAPFMPSGPTAKPATPSGK